jgi:hypothetical protein
MKKILAGCFVLLALGAFAPASAQSAAAPAAALAEQADADAAVKELLDVMQYRALMTTMLAQQTESMPAMIEQMSQQALAQNPKLSDADKEKARAMLKQQMPQLVAALHAMFADPALLDEMESAVAPIYTKYFSAAEIRQMADFYRTPVGAKMLKSMPKIAQDSILASQKTLIPRMAKLMQAFTAEPVK